MLLRELALPAESRPSSPSVVTCTQLRPNCPCTLDRYGDRFHPKQKFQTVSPGDNGKITSVTSNDAYCPF